MALTKQQKTVQLDELTKKLKDTKSVIFTQYIGLKVAEVSELRAKLKAGKAEMKVAKKTLMRIAGEKLGLPAFHEEAMDGAIACIFSYDDPLTGAQIAFKFAKDHQQVKLLGGVFEGKALSQDEAMEFAKMPGREQLLAMFMSMVRSPLSSFASMCGTPLRSFAVALSEKAKKSA